MSRISIQQAMQLAVGHHQAGRLRDAEMIYRQILAAQPNHPDALHLMGVLASQCGQGQVGVDLIGRAISLNPNDAHYRSNFGQVLLNAGKPNEAVVALRKAVEMDPNLAGAWNNLGNALIELRQFSQAVDAYMRAINIVPDFAEAHSNLGNALKELGQLDQAIVSIRKSIELRPDLLASHNNLGMCLRQTGQYAEAAEAYRKAIALKPGLAITHYNLAVTLLVQGQFEEGLAEYEWRWQAPQIGLSRPAFSQPQWDGADPAGKRVLVYAEQGFGDTIQFVRYLPLLAERGAKITLQCQPQLKRLLQRSGGVERIITLKEEPGELDLHCPLLSLPYFFKTTVETIPSCDSYLTAEPELVSQWSTRLEQYSSPLEVGLVWAGRPEHQNDRNRSVSLDELQPLRQVADVTFLCLQTGDVNRQDWLIDITAGMDDFAQTAAAIQNLDLLITVDTAVAHLAGALGKPVWLLLPFSPDWRWLLNRDDSPWYPSMRLFRQPRIGDWETPIRRIIEELSRL
ncbi:MAG TPA: tetratricopeptide repeat-containing glycosyltransferase family protein [Tepidisphaeraceae bacterium]|nr:tetratricopeptide repeat-containing glycosyltransferase family protein [Tepidisphaeraceae bacterium]